MRLGLEIILRVDFTLALQLLVLIFRLPATKLSVPACTLYADSGHFETFSRTNVSSWSGASFCLPAGVIQIVKITLGQRFEAITTKEIVILDNSK